MNSSVAIPRRGFLQAAGAAAAGLVIGFRFPLEASAQAAQDFVPNAFLRIAPSGRVTVVVGKTEMGQGVYTALPMIVAEELDADWSKIRVVAAPVNAAYNHTVFGVQITGGSTSIWTSYEQLRKAGAAARAMLIAAASASWKVEPQSCRAEKGAVIHDATKRRLTYGELAGAASKLSPPAEVTLKDPKNFTIIGKPAKRLDTPEKSSGSAVFGIDVKLPGMLTAVIARPPAIGAKMRSVNSGRARAISGVKAVYPVSSGVAVVADGYWPAKLGRDALQIEWDEGRANLSTEQLLSEYRQLARTPGLVARKDGDAAAAFSSAAQKIEAEYEVPYLAHAAMEPLNCVADVRPDSCEIWTGAQVQTVNHALAVQLTGLPPEKVRLHTTFLGGGFGRRLVPDSDFVRDAVEVSMAAKAPVKVVWSREDDMRGGWYRPLYVDRFRAGLDAGGNVLSWAHTIVGQSIALGTVFDSPIIGKDGIEFSSVEGAADVPYQIPNVFVDVHYPKPAASVWWWRSVGNSHTGFVVESFIDELAHAAKADPFEFRRRLLAKHPRHRAVLELAAEKAKWGSPPPAGRARGIAVVEAFGGFAAQVAEISMGRDGLPRVHRVVCAIDCGQVINPDTVVAQMEGGINFGLSAFFYGEITLHNGRVQQSNFHNYRMLRMHEAPAIETHILPSTERQGGVGEVGVPPIAAAVGNAIFALTGKRIRRLPLRPTDIK